MTLLTHAPLIALLLAGQTPAPAPEAAPPAATPAPAPAVTTPAPATPAPDATAPAATPAAAPAGEKLRLWVTPPTAFGITPAMMAAFSEAVNSEAGQVPNYNTVTEKDIETLLTVDQRKQAVGCADANCFTDLGKLMNAERVLSCNAGLVGDDIQVTCKLIGVKENAQLAAKDRKVINNAVALTETARAIVGILLTGQARERRGVVELKSSEAGATVLVDGKEVGSTPLKEPLKLDEGKREVTVRKSGYATWKSTMDVQAGSFTHVDANLTASRLFQIWPFGLSAIGVGFLGMLLGGVTGLALGSSADCFYGGFVGALYTEPIRNGNKGAGDNVEKAMGWSKGGCQKLPLSTPAYKTRPIDSIDYKAREQQFILVGDILANGAYGLGLAALVIGVGAGAALLATDAIIRFTRREE